jgi:hypothetical protein
METDGGDDEYLVYVDRSTRSDQVVLLEHAQHAGCDGCDTPPFLECKSSRKKKSKVNLERDPPFETVWSFSSRTSGDSLPKGGARAKADSRTSSRPTMTEEE